MMPYFGMKMTMHIDEALLARVMKSLGTDNKTEAVDLALKAADRKAKMLEIGKKGMGLSAAELKDAIDPDYDLQALRVAEVPPRYGRKRSGR